MLVRNDAYWRKPAALKRVVIRSVAEFATRKLMLAAGDADLIDVSSVMAPQLRGLEGVRLADRLPSLEVDPIFMFIYRVSPEGGNPFIGSGKLDGEGVPPDFFSDPDARRGFAYAFDYEGFVREVMKGAGAPATDVFPPGVLGHDPEAPHFTHDAPKAAAYLKKAWGGRLWEKGFRLTVATLAEYDLLRRACVVWAKDLQEINPKFRLECRDVTRALFADSAHKLRSPINIRGYMGIPDPHDFAFTLYHSRGRYATLQDFKDPELDALVETAVRELDEGKRARLYARLSRRANELAPSIPVSYPYAVYGMRTWLRGLEYNPLMVYGLFYPAYKSP